MNNSLAKVMNAQMSEIDNLVRQFPTAAVQIKDDGSPVTELDLKLSMKIEKQMKLSYPNSTFYSEENYSEWSFPLIAVDPLDGTREYLEGRDEWAISIGIFANEKFAGEGWVYNPKTLECFAHSDPKPFTQKTTYCGEVSRDEWKKGLFTSRSSEKFKITPVGSIAYKLGRLSSGKCDFVVSLRAKNIWDIAGGTLLCKKAGFKFYSKSKEVTQVQKEYEAPLIWCREELFSELSKIYP